MLSDAADHMSQVGLWMEAVELGRADQAVSRRRTLAPRFRAREEEILPTARQSRDHSAHVAQEVEVSYRWHPPYGRRLR